MSKVIHLSDDSHTKAKDYCKDNNLRMSDWVAELIEKAINGHVTPAKPVPMTRPSLAPVPKRSVSAKGDDPQNSDMVEPVYAAPPFWAARMSGRG